MPLPDMMSRVEPDAREGAGNDRRAHVRAARELSPFQQGEFDGFCGIYALINALRLVLAEAHPLSRTECEILFRHAVRFLENKHKLGVCTRSGMSLRVWRPLATDLVRAASDMVSLPLRIERQCSPRVDVPWPHVLWRLRSLIDEQSAVLLVLEGAYRHYTVVSGYSEHRLRLFDSAGFAWINVASCSTPSSDVTARHLIPPASLVIIGRG